MQKILVLDIETRPAKAYVWRAFKENIGTDQIIDGGGVICVGAKWLGDRHCELFSDWEHGHYTMLSEIHKMMSEAEAIVTYNGDRFDIPHLLGEFVLHGFPPPPPVASIDVVKQIKKFRFFVNRLAYIGPLLRVGEKVKHEGFELWSKVMDGDPAAQKKMGVYCIQDVRLLEKLYLKVRPFMQNHPFLGEGSGVCPNCGSSHVQHRGWRRTRCFRIQRIQCQDCGSWSSGTRKKV